MITRVCIESTRTNTKRRELADTRNFHPTNPSTPRFGPPYAARCASRDGLLHPRAGLRSAVRARELRLHLDSHRRQLLFLLLPASSRRVSLPSVPPYAARCNSRRPATTRTALSATSSDNSRRSLVRIDPGSNRANTSNANSRSGAGRVQLPMRRCAVRSAATVTSFATRSRESSDTR